MGPPHTVLEPPHWAARLPARRADARGAPRSRRRRRRGWTRPWPSPAVVAGHRDPGRGRSWSASRLAAAAAGRPSHASIGERRQLRYPAELGGGDRRPGQDPDEHRVIAPPRDLPDRDGDELCTSFGDPCTLAADEIPAGEASILMTAREGGTPPVPDPVTTRPYGLDADEIDRRQPAAFERRDARPGDAVAWWQLSPPGFPDRWIEVHADIAGLEPSARTCSRRSTRCSTLEFTRLRRVRRIGWRTPFARERRRLTGTDTFCVQRMPGREQGPVFPLERCSSGEGAAPGATDGEPVNEAWRSAPIETRSLPDEDWLTTVLISSSSAAGTDR